MKLGSGRMKMKLGSGRMKMKLGWERGKEKVGNAHACTLYEGVRPGISPTCTWMFGLVSSKISKHRTVSSMTC